MSSVEHAWREAGEHFARLGQELKASYERQTAADGEPGAGGGEAGRPGDRQAIEDGLRKLADALDHVATVAGNTVRDPEVRDAARLAAHALRGAISVTLDGATNGPRDRDAT